MKQTTYIVAILMVLAVATGSCTKAPPGPKHFDPPGKTTWAPEGCRLVPSTDPVLPARNAWRNLHGDTANSDEVSIALAPVFSPGWVAEPNLMINTGPTFDDQGNLYFSPLFPYESVALISLDPIDGSRRWAIEDTTGVVTGLMAPMVLNDPDNPGEQIVYFGIGDRALAVRTDGSIVWDVQVDIPLTGTLDDFVLGMNYLPQADAIVGLVSQGFVYVLDRVTGSPLLDAPFELPGEKTSPYVHALRPLVEPQMDAEFAPFLKFPEGIHTLDWAGFLAGLGAKVTNHFALDLQSGRLWVAGTAPDAEDGNEDGISELGALYGLDLVWNGSKYEIVEVCHRSFQGGSASTPTLGGDDGRLYVGDAVGNLLAIDNSCNDIWAVNIGAQILGSIGVSSDNGEVYASTGTGIVRVIDQGTSGALSLSADLDVYDISPELLSLGCINMNLNLVTIGANGIFFMAGAGTTMEGMGLPAVTGVGQLDRQTGQVRYFVDSLDGTVSVMNVGPDGAVYIGHSALRRGMARALTKFLLYQLSTPQLMGGVRKWTPERLDLLIRDAACAASARALNAFNNAVACPASAEADIQQIQTLIDQSRSSSAQAIADGDLAAADWTTLDGHFTLAEASLAPGTLDTAAGHLQMVCDFFPD